VNRDIGVRINEKPNNVHPDRKIALQLRVYLLLLIDVVTDGEGFCHFVGEGRVVTGITTFTATASFKNNFEKKEYGKESAELIDQIRSCHKSYVLSSQTESTNRVQISSPRTIHMRLVLFLLLTLIVAVEGRRGAPAPAPNSPPPVRMISPWGYPRGWGMETSASDEFPAEIIDKTSEVKEVKRTKPSTFLPHSAC
jgi:hypothetical protein